MGEDEGSGEVSRSKLCQVPRFLVLTKLSQIIKDMYKIYHKRRVRSYYPLHETPSTPILVVDIPRNCNRSSGSDAKPTHQRVAKRSSTRSSNYAATLRSSICCGLIQKHCKTRSDGNLGGASR